MAGSVHAEDRAAATLDGPTPARAAVAPSPFAPVRARATPASLLALQRAAGNRATIAALAASRTSPPAVTPAPEELASTGLELTTPRKRALMRCSPGRTHRGLQPPAPDCEQALTCPAGNTVGFGFCFDSDELRSGEDARLQSWARANRDVVAVEVHGYASVDGPDAYNLSLSCHRANAVADILAAEGIDPARVERYKHGETAEFGGTFEENRAVYVIPWYRCECVESLTLHGSGAITGSFGISHYWPVTPYWGADTTLGQFDESGSGGWRMLGHKFQVVGRFSIGRSATRVAGATFQQMARLTTTKGGTAGAWFDDMNYVDAGGGHHHWDPNAEAGTTGAGGAAGVRRTVASDEYAYTDPPAIAYRRGSFPWIGSSAGSSSYRNLEFDIYFRSSPGCPCGRRELNLRAAQEIEVSNGTPTVLRRP